MLRQNYTVSEPHQCDVCSETIQHPICPFCLSTQLEAWLTLYPNLRKSLMPRIKDYLSRLGDEALTCIKCKNKRASVCPYCFTDYVLKELKSLNAGKQILGEFFEFFNFDFNHSGYYKEAERLGVF